MMMRYAVISILLFFSAGCAHVPSRPAVIPESVIREEEQIRLSFAENLAGNFTLVSTVVFKYHFFTFTALGVTRINEPDKEFEAAVMTPVGVKLLEIKNKNGSLEGSYAMPDLAAYGDVCRIVSDNIESIYFFRVPPQGTQAGKKGRFMFFSVPSGNGVTEYLFGKEKDNVVLLHKRFINGGKREWEVSYRGYSRDRQDKMHPQYIVFTHHAYSYRLLLKVKEIRL
jgi:hypothetical protein